MTREQMARYDAYGPGLQMAMFQAKCLPDPAAVEDIAHQARERFATPH